MSEIKKLYENAGVEKAPDFNNCYPEMMKCHNCEHYKVIDEYTSRCLNEVYPEFTAEKQLELIKWLGIRDEFNSYQNKITKDWVFYDHEKDVTHYNFELCLASWVNYLWQDLTDTEKAEIKRILE